MLDFHPMFASVLILNIDLINTNDRKIVSFLQCGALVVLYPHKAASFVAKLYKPQTFLAFCEND